MPIPGLNAKTERITYRGRSENEKERIRLVVGAVLLHIKTHGRLHNPTPASSQAPPLVFYHVVVSGKTQV